jgi:tetratricopeptide (TPR) repeat protein
MGRDIGNAAIVAAAENYRGDVVMQLGRYEDARQAFQANIPVAEASGDLGILAHTFHDLAGTCTMTGRFVEGENVARRALELQRSRDAPAMAAFALTVVGIAQFYQGRLGDARASMEEAVETLRTLPPTWHTPMGLAYLGMLERVEGRGAEADAHLNEAVAMGADGYLAAALAHQWLAEGDLLQGRAPAARARLEPFAAQTNLWALEMLPTLAWAMLESGDITAADALVTRLVADDRVQMPLRQVEALRVLGMVRRRQGRYDEASNVFGESVALARRMAYPFGEGRALCEWGRLAAERGDIPEARAHLTAAGEIFGRIGAQSERDRVRSILAAT